MKIFLNFIFNLKIITLFMHENTSQMLNNIFFKYGIFYLFFLALSCSDENYFIAKSYVGFWAETEFSYYFKSNGEFIFKTDGHYGKVETIGKYVKSDSIILLYPYMDWTRHDGVLKSRLIFKKDVGCIQDFDFHFYCVEKDEQKRHEEKRFSVLRDMKDKLFDLKEIRLITERYDVDDLNYPKNVYFRHDGIILIDKKQYHSFQLMELDTNSLGLEEKFKAVQYQDYLINLYDNRIYQHHFYKDSISLVEE